MQLRCISGRRDSGWWSTRCDTLHSLRDLSTHFHFTAVLPLLSNREDFKCVIETCWYLWRHAQDGRHINQDEHAVHTHTQLTRISVGRQRFLITALWQAGLGQQICDVCYITQRHVLMTADAIALWIKWEYTRLVKSDVSKSVRLVFFVLFFISQVPVNHVLKVTVCCTSPPTCCSTAEIHFSTISNAVKVSFGVFLARQSSWRPHYSYSNNTFLCKCLNYGPTVSNNEQRVSTSCGRSSRD